MINYIVAVCTLATMAILWVSLGGAVSKTMTQAEFGEYAEKLINDAIDRNITVTAIYAGDKNTGPDGDYIGDGEDEDDYTPAFDAWAKAQAAHMMAASTPAQRDAFIRTGKMPKGFKYSSKAPHTLSSSVYS